MGVSERPEEDEVLKHQQWRLRKQSCRYRDHTESDSISGLEACASLLSPAVSGGPTAGGEALHVDWQVSFAAIAEETK